jgi:hypothetical protein
MFDVLHYLCYYCFKAWRFGEWHCFRHQEVMAVRIPFLPNKVSWIMSKETVAVCFGNTKSFFIMWLVYDLSGTLFY